MIIYAPIAPIILPLALCAFVIFWVCFRFSVISTTDTDAESNGRLYPWALLQLYTGLYVGEACWLGLFILQISNVSSILRVVCIGLLILATAMQHRQLFAKYLPLLKGCTLNQSTAWNNTAVKGNKFERYPTSLSSPENSGLLKSDDPLLPPELSLECPMIWLPKRQDALYDDAKFGSWLPTSNQGIHVDSLGRIELVDAAQPPKLRRMH